MKHPKEKKDYTAIVVIGIILVIIAAVVFYFVYHMKASSKMIDENTLTYNNYQFVKSSDNKWYVTMNIRNQDYVIPFYYSPLELENITMDPYVMQQVKNYYKYHRDDAVYITLDPEESSKLIIGGFQFGRVLGTTYNIYNFNVTSAVTRETNNTQNIPIITCRNQTSETMVIWMVVDDENQITKSKNCIILESQTQDDMIKVSEAFTYRLLGIMK